MIVATILCAAGITRAAFAPGDVIAKDYLGEVYNVTAGGNFPSSSRLAHSNNGDGSDIGKVAFSADDSVMYFSGTNSGDVYAVTSSGATSIFATGLSSPFGLLRTASGRLLVAEAGSGQITDITAGGNFTGVAPFASGITNVADITQTSDGRIFAAAWSEGNIYNISGGGAMGAGNIFASVAPDAYAVVPDASGNGLLVADPERDTIVSISSTGAEGDYVTGKAFFGLAYSGSGKLLAVDDSANVYDISGGFDMISAPVFATVASQHLNSLTTVPAVLPEPATIGFITIGAMGFIRGRWRAA